MFAWVPGRNLRPKTSGTFWGRGVQESTPSEAGNRVPGVGQVAATLGAAQVGHGSSRRPSAGETPRVEGMGYPDLKVDSVMIVLLESERLPIG